jgi:hypothetical protein
MFEKTKKHKVSISEEDTSTLLQRSHLSPPFFSFFFQYGIFWWCWIVGLMRGCVILGRYTATTVLALLQEVAHCADAKIDWEALVRNTSTGISDAREYQMLWRHLAYRHALLDEFEDGAQPLVSLICTFLSFRFFI